MSMTDHQVVTPDEWVEARKHLLAKEKEFTRLRDQLSQARRDLPWVLVTKQYVFEGPEGKQTLAQLFSDRSQLIVYHFMFDPDWEAGCKSCSFWADNFNGIVPHLNQRDVTFVAISRAPLAKLQAFATRLVWGGALNGCHPPAAISITTTPCRSRRKILPVAAPFTTTRRTRCT
jgi:predicted dithiol-disulfide oxidoreductase (DUF899 family)